ncbi:MAG: hypothetical protein K2I70_03845 [Bacilli bacterium]|nr:hypothetical protein [Bacilli bacterium]
MMKPTNMFYVYPLILCFVEHHSEKDEFYIEVTYIHLRKGKYRIVLDIINQNTSEKKLYAYVEFKTK